MSYKNGDVRHINEDPARYLICGTSGTGKTYFAKQIALRLSRYYLVVIFDTKLEKKFQDIPDLTKSAMSDPRSRGIYKVSTLIVDEIEVTDPIDVLEILSFNLFRRGNAILYVEEIGSVLPKNGRLYDIAPHFGKLVLQGRERNLGYVGVTQRAQDLNLGCVNQANEVIAFQMRASRDRSALDSFIPPKFYDSLTQYEFIYWSDRNTDGNCQVCYKIYGNQIIDYSEHMNRRKGPGI